MCNFKKNWIAFTVVPSDRRVPYRMTRKRTLKGDRKVRLRDSLGIYYTFIHLPQREKGDFTFIANAVGISSPYVTPPPNNAITVSSCKAMSLS